jgi:hypothetical protein
MPRLLDSVGLGRKNRSLCLAAGSLWLQAQATLLRGAGSGVISASPVVLVTLSSAQSLMLER